MSSKMPWHIRAFTATMLIVFIAAMSFACGGRGGGSVRPSKAKTIVSGVPEGYDATVAANIGFWASRWQVLNYAMMSRAGLPTVVDSAEMDYLKYLAGPSSGGDDPVAPTNASFMLVPFRYGNTTYAQADDGDPSNYGDERWLSADEGSGYDTLTTALLIMAETEWARQFHSLTRFGSAENSPTGATQRLQGLVLCELAKRTALHFINNQASYSGSTSSNLRMIAALAALSRILREPTIDGQTNRYRDVNFSGQLHTWMDYFFYLHTSSPTPATAEGLSEAVQCLGWFATTTLDSSLRTQATTMIRSYADGLVAYETTDPVEHAARIRGTVEASRLLFTSSYLGAASDIFEEMQKDYNTATGVFTSRSSLGAQEIARIIGALNALRSQGTGYADTDWAQLIMSDFFAASVMMSRLFGRTYPLSYISEYERPTSELRYKFPETLYHRVGATGVAPHFGARVDRTLDGTGWQISGSTFDAVGALSLAIELLAMRPSEFNPYPSYTGGLTVPLRYGQTDFTYPAAKSNAYFTGRTAAIEFALRSAAGSAFSLAPDTVATLIANVSSPTTGDSIVYPESPSLLRVPWDTASPAFLVPYNGISNDWSNYRWTAAGSTASDLSLANLLLVEVRLARHFHDDSLFGIRGFSSYGAPERMRGMMLWYAMRQQLEELRANSFSLPRTFEGRARLMLALCDAADLVSSPAQPNSATNRYRDTDLHQHIDTMVEDTWDYLSETPLPTELSDLRMYSSAMLRYAVYVADPGRAQAAKALVMAAADAAMDATPSNAVDKADLLIVLDNAIKFNAGSEIRAEFRKAFILLANEYDPYYGVFSSMERYSSEQIGILLDALLVADHAEDTLVVREAAQSMLKGFVEGTVLLSGFTRSAWAPWEYPSYQAGELPGLWVRYPTIPYPFYAGGTNGIAPVFAGQIEFVPFGGYWNVLDTLGYTPGLLHCADSLLRFDTTSFPPVEVPQTLK